VSASNFPDMLAGLLRTDAARPLATFYDDATGERIELSVATFGNWVNKTAGLVQEELDVERGGLLLIDLSTHWLGAVWLAAAWTGGLCVTADPSLADEADLVVCGPGGLEKYAQTAERRPVVGISMRPFGGRFIESLPSGVTDYGAVVLAQPDVFFPNDPPSAGDLAWRGGTTALTQAELLAMVDDPPLVGARGRLLTDVNPCSRAGLATLLSPMTRGGGTVWVANPEETSWKKRYDDERATAELRASAG